MAIGSVQVTASDGEVYNVIGDTISSRFYPVYKLTVGAAGIDDGLISSANPLPVSQPNTQVTVGQQKKTFVIDDETHNLLQEILIEQRITNIHLAAMTNMHITRENVEED